MVGIIRILLVVVFLRLSGETENNFTEYSGFFPVIEKVASIVPYGDSALSSQW